MVIEIIGVMVGITKPGDIVLWKILSFVISTDYRTLHNPVPTESTLFSRGGTGFSKDFFNNFS